MKKTILELLGTIPNELTRARAIKAFNEQPYFYASITALYHVEEKPFLAKILGLAFNWKETEEKAQFWLSVAQWAEDLRKLTESDEAISRTDIKHMNDRCPVFIDDVPNETTK